MNDPTQRIRDLEQRLANLIQIGPVSAVDLAKSTVQVKLGGIITAPILWMTRRAGNDVDWWAPEVGEQVLVLSPAGDFNQAVALPALYQSATAQCHLSRSHQRYSPCVSQDVTSLLTRSCP